MNTDDPGGTNPYASPRAESTPMVVTSGEAGHGRFAPCPHCGSTDAKVPTFTWWGGLVGHKLLSHVICRNCRRGYNGKTGRSNTANIIAYQVVALVLVVGLLALFWLLSDG